MARKVIRTPEGSLIPYGLCCDHLWTEAGLGYYAVFRAGEEQADYYCEECYERLCHNLQVPIGRCCLYCAKEVLARHFLVEEVEAS